MSLLLQLLLLLLLGAGFCEGKAAKVATGKTAGKTAGKATGGNSETPGYDEALNKVAEQINKATERSREIQDEHMKNVDKDPGNLITKNAMANMLSSSSFLPQKAGTRSITLQAGQGFNGITNYQPSGWKVTETMSGPTDKKEPSKEKEPVFSYPLGLGPMLLNQCTERSYTKSSPCYNSKLFDLENSVCMKLMDAAGYIGVGFDGRGFYSSDSRKVSLIQRVCANKATFLDQDVPDIMNVFGIFHTVAETKSFQSVDQYMRYIRHKAGLSNQKGLFTSEASKYSKSSSFGINLGGIGAIVGGIAGAVVGGPGGAALGASVGGAIGGSIEGGSGSGSGSSSSKQEGSSSSKVEQTDKTNQEQGSTQNFFAMMYVNVILYELTLDEVKPTDLSLALLKDFMELPVSYYSVGADVKYQNFLQRWGTHFIRSGKFGGQLKVTKTCKTTTAMTSQEFARMSENEFKSMFATMQSSYSQKSSSWGFLGIGGKSKSAEQSANAKSGAEYKATAESENAKSQKSRQSEFTQTSVEAQGGTPEIAEALMDFYTPAFKQLFHDWLVSIKDYAKPFEFQLKSIHDLFNMRMDTLFPAGNVDFGCVGDGEKAKVKTMVEAKTNRRFYIDTRVTLSGKKKVEEKIKVYCKYSSTERFMEDLNYRRVSLERAIGVYMVEGPFPTSSFELPAGEIGCEEKTLGNLPFFVKKTSIMTYSELKSAPFILAFDLPQEIPGIASSNAKFKSIFSLNRWFAVDPKASRMHLYDGCKVPDSKDKNICFRNVILTYEESTGVFYVKPEYFKLSKHRLPSLPNWLAGSSVARPKRLQTIGNIKDDVKSKQVSVPCNVKWLNSHRLDPDKKENCIHFTAATEGDIFIIFASIPRDHHTWYYMQINPHGVAFYKGFSLENRVVRSGMGVLGDRNLFQSFFVCVIQDKDAILMQYGKAAAKAEVGKVYSSYRFKLDHKSNRLSFYSFGSGERPVSLMDIRLTKQMPTNLECLDGDQIKVNGHCILACHAECDGCKQAKDSRACQQCRHVRVLHGSGDAQVTECLAECPAGKFLSETQGKLCVECPAGLFKDTKGNEKCKKCAPGSFSSPGAVKCSPCAPGSFSNKEGEQRCSPCAAGTAASGSGATDCAKCPRGQFSVAGQPRCQPCGFGHFSDEEGLADCKPCASGTFADAQGQESCKECPAGTTSVAGSRSCGNSCQKGEFSPTKGVACQKCPAGSFSESAGSSSCSQCAAGSYQPQAGQPQCLPAPRGSYAAARGATSVQKCAAGTFNDKEGQDSSSDCQQCDAGSFSAAAGAASCTPCAVGSFQPTSGSSSCSLATKGHFADVTGLTGQKKCLPGSFSAKTGATSCTKCPDGQSSGAAGASSCSQCPAGKFATKVGQTACSDCSAGTFSATGATACTACSAGTFATSAGSATCQKCPAGRYSAAKGATSCSACAAGHFSAEGATSCTKCPAGHFAKSKESSLCSKCPPGTYAAGTGSLACTECPAGKYSTTFGATGLSACANCPVNTHSSAGAATCAPCGDFERSDAGAAACVSCPPLVPGSYKAECYVKLPFQSCKHSSDLNGQNKCKLAMDGSTNSDASKDGVCSFTKKGLTYWEGTSSFFGSIRGVILWSRSDKFQTESTNVEVKTSTAKINWKKCGSVKKTYLTKAFQCNQKHVYRIRVQRLTYDYLALCEVEAFVAPCPAGKFFTTDYSINCQLCPINTYSAIGAKSCTKCPAGQFSESGAAFCLPCTRFACNKKVAFTSCSQTSNYDSKSVCGLAMDGSQYSLASKGDYCAITKKGYTSWEGNFKEPIFVKKIVVFGRSVNYREESTSLHVEAHDGASWHSCSTYASYSANHEFHCNRNNVVKIRVKRTSSNYLTLCEVEAYTGECPAGTVSVTAASGSCVPCPLNHFAEKGAEICSRCPGDTVAAEGSATCRPCSGAGCARKLSFSSCWQSNHYSSKSVCGRATDGETVGNKDANNVCMTTKKGMYNWVGNFETPVFVNFVILWSRTDKNWKESTNIEVEAHDGTAWHSCGSATEKYVYKTFTCNRKSDKIRVKRLTQNYLAVCEVEAYTSTT